MADPYQNEAEFLQWLERQIEYLLDAGEQQIGCSGEVALPCSGDATATMRYSPPDPLYVMKNAFLKGVGCYCDVETDQKIAESTIRTTNQLRVAMRVAKAALTGP